MSVCVVPLAVTSVTPVRFPVMFVFPFTCKVAVGSEVPIPTREFVTSKYNKLVSNARSVPFLVRLDFSTDPDIRPMAILGTSL